MVGQSWQRFMLCLGLSLRCTVIPQFVHQCDSMKSFWRRQCQHVACIHTKTLWDILRPHTPDTIFHYPFEESSRFYPAHKWDTLTCVWEEAPPPRAPWPSDWSMACPSFIGEGTHDFTRKVEALRRCLWSRTLVFDLNTGKESSILYKQMRGTTDRKRKTELTQKNSFLR